MPPIRRVLVIAVDGVQSLDVMGPIETFCYANGQVPGAYRIDVVGPARNGQITMSNGLKLGVDPLPEPPPRVDTLVVAAARAPAGGARTRHSWTGSRGPRGGRAARRRSAQVPTCW